MSMYHILIVDEEEHLLWALERNLFPERDDVVVYTASTGEEGLHILETESIDLLISDIKMPGDVDGFQLILRAKEMVPDARVMIITAFGTHRIENFAERLGISHYIEKPFTVDELRKAVLEVLDEQEGFQGVLSDLELTDIIQMLCLAKRTALLHLKHRDRRGRIVFDAGDVVHAEFDEELGPEAVYQMLSLRQGDIFMQSDFEPVERTIDIGWQDLLLEGVKRTDEQRMEEQQERTREEMGTGAFSEVDSEVEEEEAEASSERTKTPMGMGAPTLDGGDGDGADEAEEALSEESSGAMLFSEAELEEINEASEAAIEEEVGDDSADAGDAAAVDGQVQELEAEPIDDDGESTPGEVSGGAESEQEVEPTNDTDQDDGDWTAATSEQWAAAAPNGGGAFGRRPSEVDETDATASGTDVVEADAEPAPPIDDSQGPFASAERRMTPDERRAVAAAGDAEPATGGDTSSNRTNTSPGMAALDPGTVETAPDEGDDVASGTDSMTDTQIEVDEPTPEPVAEEPTSTPEPVAEKSTSNEMTSPGESVGEFDDVLADFVEECPGVKATAVLSLEDDRILQTVSLAYDGIDDDELEEPLTGVFARARRSVGALDDEDRLQELQLVLEDDYLLMRVVDGTPLVHVAVVDRSVSLGIALVLMRESATEIATSTTR